MISDDIWVAIVTAGPPTVASIVAVAIALMNNRQGEKIHVLVNSNMTAVKSELARANERIEGLQTLVSTMTEQKSDDDKQIVNMQGEADKKADTQVEPEKAKLNDTPS